jgi:hypothetical protein
MPFLRPEAGLLSAETPPVFTEMLKPNVKIRATLTVKGENTLHLGYQLH